MVTKCCTKLKRRQKPQQIYFASFLLLEQQKKEPNLFRMLLLQRLRLISIIFNSLNNYSMKSILLLLFATGFATHSFCQTNDSTEIVRLLEKESATWRSGDTTAHGGCWQAEPYSTIIIITTDGKTFSVPVDKIIHPASGTAGQGGTSKNSNYHMSIHGTAALVTHNETSTSANGSVSHTYEVRMLEKIDGQWKLTGEIIQVL